MAHIELCLHIDGEQNVYLRVPTIWDDIHKEWIGFVKTPKTQKLIYGTGKNSLELQNSFNRSISDILNKNDELSKELLDMFYPLSYWQETDSIDAHTSSQN